MESHGDVSKRKGSAGRVNYDDLWIRRGETIVEEDSICDIANSFSKEVTDTFCAMLEALKAEELDDCGKVLDVEEEAWSNKASKVSPNHVEFNVLFNANGQNVSLNHVEFNVNGQKVNPVQNVSPNHAEFNVSCNVFTSQNVYTSDIPVPTGWTNSPNSDTPIVKSVEINSKPISYAGAAGISNSEQLKSKANFRSMVADKVFDGVNISIPRIVVEKGGPWMIRKSPIILKKWSMDTSLLKEELTRIPIWVKLHDVPIQVFEEDGISLITMFIGKPVMLDSYTSSMCNDSWGRSSFARCLIEVNSEADLVDVVTIGIPSLTGDGFTKETIRVEYEWRPPRCDICKIFDHVHDHCPKKVVSPPIVATSNVVTSTVEKTNDGFQTMGKRKKNGKSKSTNGGNIATSNPALEDESDEDVENIYDKSDNLFQSSKISESLSIFTAAAC
ncbi:zinc knuckle CX2CX4HX4C containing protein [Tanacetum coccineum]